MANQKQNVLEDYVQKLALPIPITKFAMDKANHISKRICEISGRSLEVGFYLVDDYETLAKDGPVIRDVVIGHEQDVRGEHCDITPHGKIVSYREITAMKKRVVGWGHSHATFSVFYSAEDEETLEWHTRQWGLPFATNFMYNVIKEPPNKVEIIEGRGLQITFNGATFILASALFDDHAAEYLRMQEYRMLVERNTKGRYFYGMTFNAEGANPHCVVGYSVGEGLAPVVNLIQKSGAFKVVDAENPGLDKKSIDRDLITRVNQLRQHYHRIAGSIDQDVLLQKERMAKAKEALEGISKGVDNRSPMKKLCKALDESYEIMEQYRPFKTFSPEEQEKTFHEMETSWNGLITMITERAPLYKEMMKDAESRRMKLSLYHVTERRRLGETAELCAHILRYADHQEGGKDGGEHPGKQE